MLSQQAEGGTSQHLLTGCPAGFAARLGTEHITPPAGNGRVASDAVSSGAELGQEAEGVTDHSEVQPDASPPDATPPDAQLQGREEQGDAAEAAGDHTEEPAKQVSAETCPEYCWL